MTAALRKNDIVTLDELDYVLKRPHIYIGSVKEENVTKFMYEGDKMVKKTIPFIPGLLKIVEEVIDNSIDEAIETDFKYANQISVKYADGIITVRDNGRGLPIEKEKGRDRYVTEAIFTELRTGSNFDDDKRALKEKKGMNGVGVSLTNIFSKKFTVHTANGAKQYKQTFELGPVKRSTPKISESKQNFTEVVFEPNYGYFDPSDDFMAVFPDLIYRVLRNAAFCFPEITFKFNNKRLPGARLKEYMGSIHEINEYNENEKVRIGVFCSEDGFQHLSFVNGLETVRGGTHMEYVTDYLVQFLREHIQKKFKLEVKPADIRNKLFVMLNLRVGAPDFDGQTKERLITPAGQWSDRFEGIFKESFIRALVRNSEIIDPIVESYRLKKQVEENLELKRMNQGKKVARVRVEKYLPATKRHKYLVLTEGDSAKGGISGVLGRDEFSYFPLRGKPINAYEAKVAKITTNKEIQNIVKILNMRLDVDEQSNMRYENVLFACDQDADGIHIRSLLLAFFSRFAPSMLEQGRVKFLRTPLVVAKKGGKIFRYYFDMESYKSAERMGELKGTHCMYYKGLGSWNVKDLKEIIKKDGLDNFVITLEWDAVESETAVNEWLGSNSDLRKKHLRGKSFSLEAI